MPRPAHRSATSRRTWQRSRSEIASAASTRSTCAAGSRPKSSDAARDRRCGPGPNTKSIVRVGPEGIAARIGPLFGRATDKLACWCAGWRISCGSRAEVSAALCATTRTTADAESEGTTRRNPAWLLGLRLVERRGRDLNPRRTKPPETVFETAAFDRSATPPAVSTEYSSSRSPARVCGAQAASVSVRLNVLSRLVWASSLGGGTGGCP
jgi:hypothetical protein